MARSAIGGSVRLGMRGTRLGIRGLAGAFAIAAVAGSAAGLAIAGGSIPTELKMRNSPPAFHGKVKSDVAQCEPDRRVKLFKQRRDGSRRVLGRTDSDMRGKWLIEVDPLRSGAYIAKAKQHLVELDGITLLCQPDFGRVIVVD